MVTANGGVEVARFTYYPFGRDVPEQPLIDTGDLKFTGHERDSATRDYMHARYYSVVAGRFLSVDPLATNAVARRPDGWNRYAYVMDSPLIYVDPTGMYIQSITCDDSGCTMTVVADHGSAQPTHGPSTSMSDFLSGRSAPQQQNKRHAAYLRDTARQTARLLNPVRVMTDPDYLSVSLSCCFNIAATLQFTVDRYGRVYVGGGVASGPPGLGASVMFGKLSHDNANRYQIRGLLEQRSKTIEGGSYFGGGVVWTEGRYGEIAAQYGLTTPALGYSDVYSWGPYVPIN
jgi:RHS repeat-associated protein